MSTSTRLRRARISTSSRLRLCCDFEQDFWQAPSFTLPSSTHCYTALGLYHHLERHTVNSNALPWLAGSTRSRSRLDADFDAKRYILEFKITFMVMPATCFGGAGKTPRQVQAAQRWSNCRQCKLKTLAGQHGSSYRTVLWL